MAKIYYARVDEFWRKEQKYEFLEQQAHRGQVAWQTLVPDRKQTWLTEGLQAGFDDFLPMGTFEAKAGGGKAIFALFSNGVKTNRDAWAYNFNREQLAQNIQRLVKVYNDQVHKWATQRQKLNVDDFVLNDNTQISWSEGLKTILNRGTQLNYHNTNIRTSLYRPFTRSYLYFDKDLTERRYQMPTIFPTHETKNTVIWLKVGTEWPMFALMVNKIPDLLPQGGSQCFPFYTYDEDGSNRRENITDWALAQFQARYGSSRGAEEQGSGGGDASPLPLGSPAPLPINKWDIFHYVYALLHHPTYRETYAANLRRELPRIPFVEGFWAFAQAGARLAELHVNYEQQPEYPLQFIETPGEALDWRVEKMRLSKDKTQLKYNNFLTLAGIPPEVFAYKLGNRSALDWVIDQYQVSTDARSGIVNDPNNPEDEQYIVRLIGQVITVSLETVKIVKSLPALKVG